MEAVREFEEHAMASAHQSLVKEAAKYAEELNITLQLDTLHPVCVTTEGEVVTAERAGNLLKQSQEKQFLEIAKDKKKLLLRSSTQRRRRKPPPTAKFYAGYVGR